MSARGGALFRTARGRPRSRPASAAVVAVVVVLAVTSAGCSRSNDATETGEGPLEAYLAQTNTWSEEEADAAEVRFQESIAECMAGQGFEYEPVIYRAHGLSSANFEIEWGSREFAEQYGYGVTTDPWGERDDVVAEPVGGVDPNAEYVAALSPVEREAYGVALEGDQREPEPGKEAEWTYAWEQNGCTGQATYEVYVGGAVGEPFAALQDEASAVWGQAMADPAAVAARAAWGACLVDAGYPRFVERFDAENWINEQANALQAGPDGEWVPTDPEALAELHQTEIDLALADLDCQEATDLERIERETYLEYQQEFVDAHRAELDAWVEKWAEQ